MSRQHVDFKVTGTDKDSGESDNTAIKPVADGEPGQAAVFKRPSENLRTRSEFLRSAVDDLRFLSDYDRQLLLTSTGTIAWAGLPTGTFTASADLTVKPFLAPNASTAARLIICANTQAQITFRTRQNGVAGQPRAYNGANTITFDFTPVTTGTGAIVVTSDGTPNNNVHIQYDDHAVSGTTVDQIPANSMVQQFNASAVAIALGLEAVVEGTGTPPEVGFPTPPASVAASKIKDYITVPEQATRYMAGAADAEKHNITPAHLTTFFSDPLNVLLEGDVVAVSYDELVMSGDGGRRQSIDEFPEDKADSAGLNLFLVRRFPTRMPLAIPLAAVVNGQLIFINGRAYGSGESGPLIPAGSSYQGSSPNQWADTSTLPASSFEGAIDSIVNILGTKTGGTPGAIKVGFTPAGNIAANTVKGALEELDTEKAGLANANTFTNLNTFTPSVAGNAITATGNGTGAGITATGGATNGTGVLGYGNGAGSGGTFYALAASVPGNAALNGISQNTAGAKGVWGVGTGEYSGGYFQTGSNTLTTANTNGVSPVEGPGTGVVGFGATGTGGGDGGQFFARVGVGGTTSRSGVLATGSYSQTTGISSGAGGYFTGGSSTVGNANGGNGAVGVGGNPVGTGQAGIGVYGQGGTGVGAAGNTGVRGLGSGNADGVWGTGGGASGTGVFGQGGAPDGVGAWGTGTGTGAGVRGNGGTSGHGVHGVGGATVGYGVYGKATQANWSGVFGDGTSSGAGVIGRGDVGNVGTNVLNPKGGYFLGGGGADTIPTSRGGDGSIHQGGDSFYHDFGLSFGFWHVGTGGVGAYAVGGVGFTGGHGVVGYGGVGESNSAVSGSPGQSGNGGYFQGAGGDALSAATWHYAGHGAHGVGGAGVWGAQGGHGFYGQGGGSDVAGQEGYAFWAETGHLKLNGGNPATNTGWSNSLVPPNIIKAWARITTGPSPTLVNGFNISRVLTYPPTVGINIEVTMLSAMANTNYIAVFGSNGSNNVWALNSGVATTTTFSVNGRSGGTVITNLDSVSYTIYLVILGQQ